MKKRFTRIGFASVTLLVCLSLIWLVVRGGSSPNQSPHLPSVPMPTPPGKEAFTGEISPYDIRNFVLGKSESDITSLWDRLEIKTMNVSEHQQLDPQNFQFLTDCTNCEAEVFHHELDGQPGAEAIVRVRDQSSQATRYLIFTELDEPVGDWKFIGHIDSDFNKYREAQHSIVASRGGPLLVITSQGASGSGVALYGSRVFLTKPTGLREVLYHTTEGSQAGHFDPSRVFFRPHRFC